MITASHNPAAFNGFKLKAHYGGSAEPAVCHGVEAMLDKNPVRTFSLDDALQGKRVVIKTFARRITPRSNGWLIFH